MRLLLLLWLLFATPVFTKDFGSISCNLAFGPTADNRIPSITWTEHGGQLWLLLERTLLWAHFDNGTFTIYDYYWDYKIFDHPFQEYSGIYCLGENSWLLYGKDGTLVTVAGGEIETIIYGDLVRTHVLSEAGEGLCFVEENDSVLAYDSKYQLKLDNPADIFTVTVKGPKTLLFLYGQNGTQYSPRAFSQIPAGFIHGHTMYLFSMHNSTVYILDYTLVKENIGWKKDFEVEFQTKSFEEFIVCTNLPWYIYAIGVAVIVAIIVVLCTTCCLLSFLQISIYKRCCERRRERSVPRKRVKRPPVRLTTTSSSSTTSNSSSSQSHR